MTPSKKLNRMLYGTRNAGLPSRPMADIERDPDDREPSPETQQALRETLAILGAANGGRRRI